MKDTMSIPNKSNIIFGQENLRDEIIRLLTQNNCIFQHIIHEQTPTSQDSAKARDTTLSEGVKSIILRGKSTKKNYQFNLPSNLKLDMKAVAEITGEKCEFENPEIIKERFGLNIGGIPPFGNLLNLETFFDKEIINSVRSAFNCGLLTESIVMQSKDLINLVQPKFGHFSKT